MRFRLGSELSEMVLLVRHYIEGVGYVTCNQKPYKAKDGTFRLWGREENTCIFCEERRALKLTLEAKARAENRTLNKDDNAAMAKLHKRHVQLAAKAMVEVKEKQTVKQEMASKAMLFKAQDMFFDQLTQNYKTLSDINNTKGTLCDFWYTMTGNGTIMQDEKIDKEEKKIPIDVDLSYFETQTKSYVVGRDKYKKVSVAASEAEPMDEDDLLF